MQLDHYSSDQSSYHSAIMALNMSSAHSLVVTVILVDHLLLNIFFSLVNYTILVTQLLTIACFTFSFIISTLQLMHIRSFVVNCITSPPES